MKEDSFGVWTRPAPPSRGWAGIWEKLGHASATDWILVVFLSLLALSIGVLKVVEGREAAWSLALLVIVIPLIVYPFISISAVSRSSREFRAWMKDRGDGVGAPVLMTVLRQDKVLGQTEGLLSFRDNALAFEGIGASFVLRALDTDFPENLIANGPLFRSGKKITIGNHASGGFAWGFLLAEEPEVRLNIFPLDRRADFRLLPISDGRNDIQCALYRWLVDRPASTVETVLPPITAQPKSD